MEAHITAAFDRDLESVQSSLMKMGGLVEGAILDAATALDTRDAELAQRVREGDGAVDMLEMQVNEEVARLIARRQPAAGDLRTVLSVMKIAGNLERVGDYAKNIAKRGQQLDGATVPPDAAGTIRRMARQVAHMLKDALDAYIQRDADLARDVRNRDAEIDQMYNALFRVFLTHMMEDPRSISGCMHLHFIAKNVERMGDHVTAIAEQVIYAVTGTLPDDDRPKADTTGGGFAGIAGE